MSFTIDSYLKVLNSCEPVNEVDSYFTFVQHSYLKNTGKLLTKQSFTEKIGLRTLEGLGVSELTVLVSQNEELFKGIFGKK